MPLLMSTPEGHGGLGFSSNEIGLALFGQGVLLVTHVLLLFPYMKERLGTLELFWVAAVTCPLVCCLSPFLVDIQPHVSAPASSLPTRNPKPETRNPKPETRNPKPETRNPKLKTSSLEPRAPNATPKNPNAKRTSPNL
jgi:hypothetical protein